MQIRWYDYDFEKWEVQYNYCSEFGGHIPYLYFSVNFKLSGLNHRKHMGTQDDKSKSFFFKQQQFASKVS